VRTVGVSTDGHGRATRAACPGLTRAAEPGVHPCVSSGGREAFPGGAGGEGRCADG
jgi:hypothetical protein